MSKKIKFKLIITYILLLPLIIQAQTNDVDSIRWDQRMIKEAVIWKELLVNYGDVNRIITWKERKQALTRLIEKYPNSQWVDDAHLLLEGGKAIFENDIDGSIKRLRKITESFPIGSTIINSWNPSSGCRINEAWLMWAPGLVHLNTDNTVRISFPFNGDGIISKLEEEILTYFEHIEKYPQSTKDVAKYIISLMLREKGDIMGAIIELESILYEYPDLSIIRNSDYDLAIKNEGRLIECEPPFDVRPIWRVQYASCLLLIDLYQLQNNKEKVNGLTLKLSSECSPDGWYWNINKFLGDIYLKSGNQKLAYEQYELSIKGIYKIAQNQSLKMKLLYEEGHIIKTDDFTSWENEALKLYGSTIEKIKDSQNKLTLINK